MRDRWEASNIPCLHVAHPGRCGLQLPGPLADTLKLGEHKEEHLHVGRMTLWSGLGMDGVLPPLQHPTHH
jgi:hypothetical protein